MTQEKPKNYTAEFRESAVKVAAESDKPVAQTARDLGINENTLQPLDWQIYAPTGD
ncbi:transposase [Crenothrix sp.]|uniref:transposase n=1 Tax=Crenothrix sp. TaxID=3100433 RepID=UPI00374D124E